MKICCLGEGKWEREEGRGERKQHTEIGSRDKAKLQASSTKLQGNSNPQATGAALVASWLVASWLVASLVLGV